MNKKKIIHFISSLKRGGKERQLSTIYKYNNSDLYCMKILLFHRNENSYINEYSIKDEDIIIVNSKNFFLRIFFVCKVFNKEKPHIVFAWGDLEALISMILKSLHSYVLINGSIRHGIVLRKISHKIRKIILKFSKNVVANSIAGLKANQIKNGKILYNGIDKSFFNDIDFNGKDSLFCSFSHPVLISVANFVPYKDYETILRALKVINENNIEFSYIIIGKGFMENKIRNLIEEFGLKKKVTVYNNVDNIKVFLINSDMFIHSSKGEGCSNAILEAMASKLPIIATNTGGTSEFVTSERGVLFQYGNFEDLAKKIESFLLNPSFTKQKGMNAYNYVKEFHNVETMMLDYYRLIDFFYEKR